MRGITILTDVTPDMDIAKNLEIFGPVVPIIEISNLDVQAPA